MWLLNTIYLLYTVPPFLQLMDDSVLILHADRLNIPKNDLIKMNQATSRYINFKKGKSLNRYAGEDLCLASEEHLQFNKVVLFHSFIQLGYPSRKATFSSSLMTTSFEKS